MKHLPVLIVLFCCFFITAQNKLRHEVYFDTDKYSVKNFEQQQLLHFIKNLDSITIEKITISGYCDDRGSIAYNKILSQNRANAIKTVFIDHNIADSLITNVDGKGELLLKIIATNSINKTRSLNRKVDIVVFTKQPENSPTTKNNTNKTIDDLTFDNLHVGDLIKLENLYFKMGYSFLIPESKKKLEIIAQKLKKRDDVYFTIQGHVCCTENERDAIDRATGIRNLSYARAKYVHDYLVKYGVNKNRMRYEGLKRKFPLGGKPQYDRRVNILITYISDR